MNNESIQKLFLVATESLKKAYSPYSNKKVGAAIEFKSGAVFGGCNIENASFGATVCAERSALWSGLSHLGQQEVHQILVVSQNHPPWPPCGLCLQTLAEFTPPEALVHLANETGVHVTKTFKEFLPAAFTPAQSGLLSSF